jgi:lipoate-protein ligase A
MEKIQCKVLDLPVKGALFNTALDQFLLQKASQGEFSLVFTRWQPSVLIGNSESLALDVDQQECKKRGVSIMRRFSGGQAVYLDENYIVFSLAGPRSCFPSSLDNLRKQLCEAMVGALRRCGIPAVFLGPDNLIVNFPKVRTIGNSGQVIKRDAVLLQASVRYDLTDDSLRQMLRVLKINGQSLSEFFKPAKEALACVKEFANMDIDELKKELAEEILISYQCQSYYYDRLEPEAERKIEELAINLISDMRLEDKPHYEAKGVCYFYLNGRCIIPEIVDFLPYNKPSTHFDSFID